MLTKKRVIWLLIAVFVFISAFIFLYDFPKKINVEYEAIEVYEGELEEWKETTIQISGILSRPLFSNTTFNGEFIIAGYDITKDYDELIEIELSELPDKSIFGALVYADVRSKDLQPIATFYTSEEFDQFNVNFVSEDKDGTQHWLSAPAKTLREATEIRERLN